MRSVPANRIRRTGGAHERARPDKFHAGLLAEPLGEHGLSQAGIAEDHHRIAEQEYPVLANDRLPAILPLVRERSFYFGHHRCRRRMGHDHVLELYGNPVRTVIWPRFPVPSSPAIRRESARMIAEFLSTRQLEQSMPSLSKFMNCHQVEWRESNISSTDMGTWRGDPYPWIVPRNLWEEGLWPGIRTGSDNPLTAYIKQVGRPEA